MKQILLIALLATLLGTSYSAATTAAACDATATTGNGWTSKGVCKYKDPSCKTVGTDGVCTCWTGFTLNTAKDACTCANFAHQAANGDWSCIDSAGVDTANVDTKGACWGGWGILLNKAGGKKACKVCDALTKGTCLQCDATDQTAKTKCQACYDGSTTEIQVCGVTAGSMIVKGYGELTKNTKGYFLGADNVATFCPDNCATCESATKCLTCTAGTGLDTANLCKACTATQKTGTDNKCVEVFGCKEVVHADGKCKADSCDDTKNLKKAPKTDGTCECADGYKYQAADDTKDPKLKEECIADAPKCDPACQSNEECKKDGDKTKCEPKAASACTDAATAKTGCDKCTKNGEVWECTACVNTTTFELKEKKCVCKAKHAKNPDAAQCVTCTPACKDTEFCNWDTATKKGKCGATDNSGGSGGSGSGSNGILISAISMILAIILA